MMLFGEKYGDEVRVLDIGSSRELCGGTHVRAPATSACSRSSAEGGVAAGIRRVEAVTGDVALAYVQQQEALLHGMAGALKAQPQRSPAASGGARQREGAGEGTGPPEEQARLASQGDDLVSQAVESRASRCWPRARRRRRQGAARDHGQAQGQAQERRDRAGRGRRRQGQLIAGVTADLTGKVKAGELVNFVAQQVGGKGGGRPTWRRPAAPSRSACRRRWPRCRLG
jgi:alanyl-tRNA synthetase